MELNQWFQKGLTAEKYVESMESHKENFQHIYHHFALPDDDAFFNELQAKKLRVIALTEDWCGDAMLNIPILLRLAEKADIPVRMILRDSNLELMDQYLTNGTSRSIPIFIFINEDGKEIATWGPRAEKIQQYADQARKELPAKEAGNYKVAFHEFVQSMSNKFRNDTSFWTIVYESLKDTLQKKIN